MTHRRKKVPLFVFAFICCLLSGATVYAADSNEIERAEIPRTGSETQRIDSLYHPPIIETLKSGRKFLFFPAGDLYPPYAADPVRTSLGIQPIYVSKVAIANATKRRINLRSGAVAGLVRSEPSNEPGISWQVSLTGGFNDQNDIGRSLDNIGWDGHYGLLTTLAPSKDLAFKLGLVHVSSHVGDEFAEKTGRRRIGYTRQEVAAGASWFIRDRWRIYAESGKAFSMGNRELQKPWRRQFGGEYESVPLFWKERVAWYAAVDAQSMQERGWRADVAVQSGLVLRSEGRIWRFGVEWYNGRPPIEEFFQETERYLSFGLWIDI